MVINNFIEFIFSCSLFFNAFLFIPQSLKIYKTKNSSGVSLFTFFGFILMQIFAIFHGFLKKDYILISGFSLSLITCVITTILAIKYRVVNNK